MRRPGTFQEHVSLCGLYARIILPCRRKSFFQQTAGPLACLLQAVAFADALVQLQRGNMALARDLGYTVEEQQFTRDEFYIADEAFFTGTAAEITPIRELDHRQIGVGHAGPVTKHLQKEFFKIVKGQNPKYEGWLHRFTI